MAFDLEVSPSAEIEKERDYFDNTVWLVSVEAEHTELVITARSVVEAWEPGSEHPGGLGRGGAGLPSCARIRLAQPQGPPA